MFTKSYCNKRVSFIAEAFIQAREEDKIKFEESKEF